MYLLSRFYRALVEKCASLTFILFMNLVHSKQAVSHPKFLFINTRPGKQRGMMFLALMAWILSLMPSLKSKWGQYTKWTSNKVLKYHKTSQLSTVPWVLIFSPNMNKVLFLFEYISKILFFQSDVWRYGWIIYVSKKEILL